MQFLIKYWFFITVELRIFDKWSWTLLVDFFDHLKVLDQCELLMLAFNLVFRDMFLKLNIGYKLFIRNKSKATEKAKKKLALLCWSRKLKMHVLNTFYGFSIRQKIKNQNSTKMQTKKLSKIYLPNTLLIRKFYFLIICCR